MTDDELVKEIEAQHRLMVAVATGGPRIETVNEEYVERRRRILAGLAERGIEDVNPYSDLWDWYDKWSSGDLPSYQSRRQYLSGLFRPLVDAVQRPKQIQGMRPEVQLTGRTKVDRQLVEVRVRLGEAQAEEQYQSVGHLCRETLLTLAETVYDPTKHRALDGVEPSKTDAKRMLDAFIAAELGGDTNEDVRRHAKAALVLAHALAHKRTADFRMTALCAEATTSVVNIVAIIAGWRGPLAASPAFAHPQGTEAAVSSDARELLNEAVVKGQGHILHPDAFLHRGMTIEDSKETARRTAALEELEALGLLRFVSGSLYLVTKEGFRLADKEWGPG